MFSALQKRFGTASMVVAILALVAALAGGAWAASGALTGKQKKEVEKIAKKFSGKPGAIGPIGPAGAAGAAGAQGPPGPQGAQGPQGQQGSPGAAGKEGSPWTVGGTLPSGKTETGTWSLAREEGATLQSITIPISFPIPLAAPLGEPEVHLIAPTGEELFLEGIEIKQRPPTKCGGALTPPGTAAKPAAAPGNLCVYVTQTSPSTVGEEKMVTELIVNPGDTCEEFGCAALASGPGAGTSTVGALVWVLESAPWKGWGTWAVTAP